MNRIHDSRVRLCALALASLVGAAGCTAFNAPRTPVPVTPPDPPPNSPAPRELAMTTLPRYVIEPPDVLMINAIKIVPKPPHLIEPFDGLLIRVTNAFQDEPIANAYPVSPDGTVDLGPTYGKVAVVGLRIDEAQDAVREQLSKVLEDPQVSLSLAYSSGAQQIVGEHLVAYDGRVNLGTYGSVYVTGMTLEEAKAAIEEKLSEKLEDPEVIVDVFAYNSKRYYIITQGGGFGDNIVEQPITGNDTVLSALARIGGISQLSSTKIWIARPAPNGVGCAQILPVDYDQIAREGIVSTNYQLLPGDRLYIAEDPMLKFDSVISKITRPWERLFGFVSLGTATLNRIERFGLGNLQ